MTIILSCLLIGAVLPYVYAGLSGPYRTRQFGNVDITQPRVQGERLVDGGARVWGAQANAWEALALFTVANVAAMLAGLDPSGWWSTAAMIWVAARVAHGVFYVAGIPMLRILFFATGLAMSISIFVVALTA